MSDTTVETAAKAERVVESVTMEDGRVVEFVGKRKVLKETLIDLTKITEDAGIVQFEAGAVSVRFDVKNGATRTFALPLTLIAKFAGHGAEQKYGDELAAPASSPLSEDDIVLALEDLDSRIQKSEWRVKKEGGGSAAGASIVIQAIMEATGKDVATVKAFLQKKLDADSTLTRQQLYASFRSPTSKTGIIIRRLEEAKAAKAVKVDSDSLLGEI